MVYSYLYQIRRKELMPKNANSISLTDDELRYLTSVTQKGTVQARVYKRAKILLLKSQRLSNEFIAAYSNKTKKKRPKTSWIIKLFNVNYTSWLFLRDEIALPEIWKSDNRKTEIISCEFTRVGSYLIHTPHALICLFQDRCWWCW